MKTSALEPQPALLLAAYLCGRRQATEELRPALDQALRQALSDPLTGLPNRRAVEHHLAGAVQDGTALVVGLVDVRGLRRVNNSAGHCAGDQLLRVVGAALSAVAVGAGAWVGHLSGDEFVWVMTGPEPQATARTDDLIHRSLTGCRMATPHLDPPEVSIGWATSAEVPADGVMAAAGIALAWAKRAHTHRDGSTVHSVRYERDPSATYAPAGGRIPAQVRRSAPDTVGDQIAGLDLVPSRVVPVTAGRPDTDNGPRPSAEVASCGGVARIPAPRRP